jgi:tetratricopeptide (TPR) repeat protein
MRITGTALCALFLATAAALAADDPWLPPAPSGSDIMVTLTTSKNPDEFDMMLGGKQAWEGADGPARAEPALSKEEKDELARCRALLEKADETAAKAIDDMIAKNPSNWDAHVLRGRALHAAKNHADALAALRTAVIGNRRDPEAWTSLAEVAKALGKRVVRPKIAMRGWVRELGPRKYEFGHCAEDADSMAWNNYAAARTWYRHEGAFKRDFPEAKAYVFTFREQMTAMGVLAVSAADDRKSGKKLSADLKRVLAEKAAGTLPPFTFFAAYPQPVPAAPESGFDTLLPRLVKYFDEKIVVK